MRAVVFYSMLNESYRLDAEFKIEQMNLLVSPNLESGERQELYRTYQESATDLLTADILPKDDGGWGDLTEALQ